MKITHIVYTMLRDTLYIRDTNKRQTALRVKPGQSRQSDNESVTTFTQKRLHERCKKFVLVITNIPNSQSVKLMSIPWNLCRLDGNASRLWPEIYCITRKIPIYIFNLAAGKPRNCLSSPRVSQVASAIDKKFLTYPHSYNDSFLIYGIFVCPCITPHPSQSNSTSSFSCVALIFGDTWIQTWRLRFGSTLFNNQQIQLVNTVVLTILNSAGRNGVISWLGKD